MPAEGTTGGAQRMSAKDDLAGTLLAGVVGAERSRLMAVVAAPPRRALQRRRHITVGPLPAAEQHRLTIDEKQRQLATCRSELKRHAAAAWALRRDGQLRRAQSADARAAATRRQLVQLRAALARLQRRRNPPVT